jgi:hypothetical protein
MPYGSDLDLVAALQDDSIDRIVLMRDISLGADWNSQVRASLASRKGVRGCNCLPALHHLRLLLVMRQRNFVL